jgi:murein tripeptide amidase MpaA
MNPGEEHRWSTVREEACELFGDNPGGQLEADVMEHFAEDPDRVIRTIHRIAKAEGVLSKWAVLRADLKRTAQADVVVSATTSRAKAVDRAKHWIDNAGLHYDRQDHVLADLFGDEYAKGPLTPYDTPELRNELTTYWHQARPRGEQADKDFEAWNAKAKADRALVLALRNKPTSEDIDFT